MVSTGYSLYYPLEIPYVTIDSQMFLGQSALSFFTYFYPPQYIAINSTRPLAAINWLMFLEHLEQSALSFSPPFIHHNTLLSTEQDHWQQLIG